MSVYHIRSLDPYVCLLYKVTGDTIYNLIKLNDLHTDDNDRPIEPPKIKKTEVCLANIYQCVV